MFRPLHKIGNAIEGAPPLVYWGIIVLLAGALFAILAHIIYTFYRAMAAPPELPRVQQEEQPHLSDLKDRAFDLAAAGNYVDASRMLYKAALLLLEQSRGSRLRVGLTNQEYLGTFKVSWVIEHLQVFVDLIDWKWYRDRSFDRVDFESCRQAFASLEQRLEGEA